mmetsp:Transcript_13599/g.38959  ORF Transcript_13599/g.38959 Transcript_13599/m.38959 type:complete len:226 (-) Transcript_13599:2581-3258(-)
MIGASTVPAPAVPAVPDAVPTLEMAACRLPSPPTTVPSKPPRTPSWTRSSSERPRWNHPCIRLRSPPRRICSCVLGCALCWRGTIACSATRLPRVAGGSILPNWPVPSVTSSRRPTFVPSAITRRPMSRPSAKPLPAASLGWVRRHRSRSLPLAVAIHLVPAPPAPQLPAYRHRQPWRKCRFWAIPWPKRCQDSAIPRICPIPPSSNRCWIVETTSRWRGTLRKR